MTTDPATTTMPTPRQTQPYLMMTTSPLSRAVRMSLCSHQVSHCLVCPRVGEVVSSRRWLSRATSRTRNSKVPRTDGCIPKTKASGEKSLEKYMNGPHHFKRSLTHGLKAVRTVPKERETYSSWPRWQPTTRSKKMKRGTTSTSSSNNCAKKEMRKMKLVPFWKKCRKILDETKARASETEQKIFGRFDENMRTWTEDRGRPHFIMDKRWQMFHRNDTKTLKLAKDFEELLGHGTTSRVVGVRQNPEIFGLK